MTSGADRIGELVSDVQLPLENIEFVIEQYLMANAVWLDPETSILLAGVRDGVGKIAALSRTLTSARGVDRSATGPRALQHGRGRGGSPHPEAA